MVLYNIFGGKGTARERMGLLWFWHTEEDIQKALNDMPQGMLALFDRMASSIDAMKEDSPRNHALALRILAWVACSS